MFIFVWHEFFITWIILKPWCDNKALQFIFFKYLCYLDLNVKLIACVLFAFIMIKFFTKIFFWILQLFFDYFYLIRSCWIKWRGESKNNFDHVILNYFEWNKTPKTYLKVDNCLLKTLKNYNLNAKKTQSLLFFSGLESCSYWESIVCFLFHKFINNSYFAFHSYLPLKMRLLSYRYEIHLRLPLHVFFYYISTSFCVVNNQISTLAQ